MTNQQQPPPPSPPPKKEKSLRRRVSEWLDEMEQRYPGSKVPWEIPKFIGTCTFCNATKVLVQRQDYTEIYRRDFPEEAEPDKIYYYDICKRCEEKTDDQLDELEEQNPSLFKEYKNGDLTIGQLCTLLGNHVCRPIKKDDDDDN